MIHDKTWELFNLNQKNISHVGENSTASMNRRNDRLIHLTPIKAQAYLEFTPNRRLDQDVTSSYIHIKNYKCSKTTKKYCMRPPPSPF